MSYIQTPIVWYPHFIFYSVGIAIASIISKRVFTYIPPLSCQLLFIIIINILFLLYWADSELIMPRGEENYNKVIH